MLGIIAALALAAASDLSAGATRSSSAPTVSPVSTILDAPPGKRLANPGDKVCWYAEPTGSHIRVPVCATRAERDELERAAREMLKRNDRSGYAR
jgi:hypothetical protein